MQHLHSLSTFRNIPNAPSNTIWLPVQGQLRWASASHAQILKNPGGLHFFFFLSFFRSFFVFARHTQDLTVTFPVMCNLIPSAMICFLELFLANTAFEFFTFPFLGFLFCFATWTPRFCMPTESIVFVFLSQMRYRKCCPALARHLVQCQLTFPRAL